MAIANHTTTDNHLNDLTDYDNYTDEELLEFVFKAGITSQIPLNVALIQSLALRLQNAIEEREMVEAEA